MLDWLKHIGKEYPEFWKEYLVQLETPSLRKVAIYFDVTGINPSKDKIISIGAISIENNQIIIENSLEVTIDKENLAPGKELSYEEVQAIESFINFIGNATLVGHRIHYDMDILNEYLSKIQCGRIKSNILDVEVMHSRILDQTSKQYALTELFEYYNIKNPEVESSGNSAYMIALLFLKMRGKLNL